MPFAETFKRAMGFPVQGQSVNGFTVERSEVRHEGTGEGVYRYPFELTVAGAGGRQGVKAAFRELFSFRRTVFSGYGNPYQLRFGKVEVEGIGERRYIVSGRGIGVRIFLDTELRLFLEHLRGSGFLKEDAPTETVVTDYLERYQVEARRKRPGR